jgi:hypothetical protein
MRRSAAALVAFAFALNTIPAPIAVAQEMATLSGTAQNSSGRALARYTVQVRDAVSGDVVGSTLSNSAGSFTFTGLPPASYIVEVVDAAGQVVGTSAVTTVTAGANVAVAVQAAAIAGATGGFMTMPLLLTILGAAGGVSAWAVAENQEEASPSR